MKKFLIIGAMALVLTMLLWGGVIPFPFNNGVMEKDFITPLFIGIFVIIILWKITLPIGLSYIIWMTGATIIASNTEEWRVTIYVVTLIIMLVIWLIAMSLAEDE